MTTPSGQGAPIGLGWGIQNQETMILPTNALSTSPPTQFAQPPTATGNIAGQTSEAEAVNQTPVANYLLVMLAIVVLLVVLKFASEHEKSGMDPHIMGVGVWNFLVVTIMAVLGIAGLKTILIKYPVKGLTQVVNAA